MITQVDKISKFGLQISSHQGVGCRLVNGWIIQGADETVTETLSDMVILPDFTIPEDIDQQTQKEALDDYILQSELGETEWTALLVGYNSWEPGESVIVGDNRTYNSKLYKCVQKHTTQTDWHPDVVPNLWTEVVPAGVIPDWVQPTGAQDAYQVGDKVSFEGHIYESLIAANVWSPTAHPAGWKLIS